MQEHQSQGDPCAKCTLPALKHRAPRMHHTPMGDPCCHVLRDGRVCGLEPSAHRPRADAMKRAFYDKDRPDRRADRRIVGVDGEGHDICGDCGGTWDSEKKRCAACGSTYNAHLYTYLAAVDEEGNLLSDAYDEEGLTHEACVEMMLRIPRNTLKFAFMFSYDVTKILEGIHVFREGRFTLEPTGLTRFDRYRLVRPEMRRKRTCRDCRTRFRASRGPTCPACGSSNVRSFISHLVPGDGNKNGYGFFNGSLTVASGYMKPGHNSIRAKDRQTKRPGGKWQRATCVKDVFRFFQCSFVEALKKWDIGTPEQRNEITRMKGLRGTRDFAESADDVRRYCQLECHLLAVMMRKLITARDAVGLKSPHFDGAGSLATTMLKNHGVAEYKGPELETLEKNHPGLGHAIMSAYFGGRFEHSMVGRIETPVWAKDIGSAYPYAMSSHPCLACGDWRRAEPRNLLGQVERARLAICKFRIHDLPEKARMEMAWAPLPYRDKEEGRIVYPVNFTGWAHKPEMLSALAGWPELVELVDAWLYDTKCSHAPFAFLPRYYRERVALGSDGRGLILKNGMNACAGKTMQRVGDSPKFRSWIWGGLTTATTRGQMLDVIGPCPDPWTILGVATDAVFTTKDVWTPTPRDTGTSGLFERGDPSKPKGALGAFGNEIYSEGVFFVKPGMMLSLDLVDGKLAGEDAERAKERQKKLTKARGLGRRELAEQAALIGQGWDQWDRTDMTFSVTMKSRRFFGVKHALFMLSRSITCEHATNRKWMGHGPCPQCGNRAALRSAHLAYGPQCKDCERRQVAELRARGASGEGLPPEHLAQAESEGWFISGTFVFNEKGIRELLRLSDWEVRKSYCGGCSRPRYGRWEEIDHETRFDPWPKRERILHGGAASRMHVRDMGGAESAPYLLQTTPEGKVSAEGKAFELEQPDWDGDDEEEAL